MQARILAFMVAFAASSGVGCFASDEVSCGPGTRLEGHTCIVAGEASGTGGSAADAGGCATPVTYYRDADGDGYGSTEKQLACNSPGAGWVTEGGDCNDDESRVFPGSTAFHDVPYGTPPSDSFDYNCDGVEEPDPGLALFSGYCSGTYPDCSTQEGYDPTTRTTGGGRSAYCGSTTYRRCGGVYAGPTTLEYCGSGTTTTTALGCR